MAASRAICPGNLAIPALPEENRPVRRVSIAIAATAAFLAGCQPGPGRTALRRDRATSEVVPPASASFEGGSAPSILRAAVAVLRADGLTFSACEPTRVATRTAELDRPCSSGTCLARESVVVRVGYRVARVVVDREYWNPTTRSWAPERSEISTSDALLHEERLLARILGAHAARQTASAPECDIAPPPPGGDGDSRLSAR
jgi:hypothetical protein